MNNIAPQMPISEILRLYPETISVFRAFGMKCAEDSGLASLTLEENFMAEQVNFIELLGQLNKVINPKKESETNYSNSKYSQVSIGETKIEVEIPAEIGKVIAEHISCREKLKVIHIFGYICLGILLLAYMLSAVTISLYNSSPTVAICMILPICIWVFLSFWFRKKTIGIVGTQGFVEYQISKRTQQVVSRKLCLFKDVTELVFPHTVNYMNGVYTGTTFKFKLKNGKTTLYKETGKYHNLQRKEEKYNWKYNYLCEIENARTSYLLKTLTSSV